MSTFSQKTPAKQTFQSGLLRFEWFNNLHKQNVWLWAMPDWVHHLRGSSSLRRRSICIDLNIQGHCLEWAETVFPLRGWSASISMLKWNWTLQYTAFLHELNSYCAFFLWNIKHETFGMLKASTTCKKIAFLKKVTTMHVLYVSTSFPKQDFIVPAVRGIAQRERKTTAAQECRCSSTHILSRLSG